MDGILRRLCEQLASTVATLNEEDFPALYGDANEESLNAQNRFLIALRLRLGCLLLAAVGGVIGLKFSAIGDWILAGPIDLGGFLALLAFAGAIGAETYTRVAAPDRIWYEGRAAAESVKTLTWRYAVKGESFADAETNAPDETFIRAIRGVLQDLRDLKIPPSTERQHQISNRMRELRAASFDDRREAYLQGRIEDQRLWYAKKARLNGQIGDRWTIAVITLELVGVLAAALKAFGHADVDLLGILAAVAATITAWVQAKQHHALAVAYGITARELATVASELRQINEEDRWAEFVGQAEEAISREHTLWRASRGIRDARKQARE